VIKPNYRYQKRAGLTALRNKRALAVDRNVLHRSGEVAAKSARRRTTGERMGSDEETSVVEPDPAAPLSRRASARLTAPLTWWSTGLRGSRTSASERQLSSGYPAKLKESPQRFHRLPKPPGKLSYTPKTWRILHPIASAGGQPCTLFNGAEARRSSVEPKLLSQEAPAQPPRMFGLMPGQARGDFQGPWLNIHGLHAAGDAHGRGMKRFPCPRLADNERGDAEMTRFFSDCR
jgi:hypothetical protein